MLFKWLLFSLFSEIHKTSAAALVCSLVYLANYIKLQRVAAFEIINYQLLIL